MAKQKKRNQRKGRPRPEQQDQRQGVPNSAASPFHPLNLFFDNRRYSAIPKSTSHIASGGGSAQYIDRPPDGAYFDYTVDSDNEAGNGNIDIQADRHRRHTTNVTTTTATTTPTTGTTFIPGKSASAPIYDSSDMDTAGSLGQGTLEEDVCFQPRDEARNKTGIDYETLEEFIQDEKRCLKNSHERRRRLSNMGSFQDSQRYRSDYYGDNLKFLDLANKSGDRISFYSPTLTSTIHASSLSDIPSHGERLSDLLRRDYFWIDIQSPTDAEMRTLSKVFHIHPLTVEDITMEEPREKCEVFKNYYFISFRTFDQDHHSITYMQPLGMYILILKEGILTFHFRPMPHPHNVRKRIKQLKDYMDVTPDWICYALLDDITDSFAPLIRSIEFEVDSIDELVLILKESEQSDMLRRIGYCRKRMMSLLRLLVSKADVVKTIVKRGEANDADSTRPVLSSDVALYLGDVQDHIITMLQSLNHYEKISSRSHSNYLAQISIEMTQTNNEINDILSKLTALGSILIPMNLVTGLWGMNVQVPGQYQEDLTWFMCIMGSILLFCLGSTLVMRYYSLI